MSTMPATDKGALTTTTTNKEATATIATTATIAGKDTRSTCTKEP